MALLSYDERDYTRKQALLHSEREAKTARKLAAFLRSYAAEVHSSYLSLGIPVFPSEAQDRLTGVLLNEYMKTADYFSSFHDEYLTIPFVNEGKTMLAIQDRLDEILPQLALLQSDRVLRTTEKDLIRAVAKAREASPGVESRTLEARLVHLDLVNKAAPRSKAIAATETTRVAEISKEVGIQETVRHLEPEELNQAFADELDSDDLSTALAIGGGAALAEGIISSVRTWNPVLDGDTRIAHAAAAGQMANQDGVFDIGGEELAFPGDPSGSAGNTINCRCFLTYSV